MTPAADETVDLDRVRIDPAWALRIPVSLAMRRQVLPLARLHGRVQLAATTKPDAATLEAVVRFTGHEVDWVRVEAAALGRALARVYGDGTATTVGHREGESTDGLSVADELLRAALMRRASDIHIDPMRDEVRVRFRVDGELEDYRRLPSVAHAALCSRLKVMAGMDIAERRAPQDGGFSHVFGAGQAGRKVDCRVASLPTRHGERLTVRLLAGEADRFSLAGLGLSDRDLRSFSSVLEQPHGLVLLTGPTGCGKTTTLHAAIRHLLDQDSLNIITVEDPVEYEIPGVAQVEVDAADKVSFHRALRSLLRHDPDVLVIGEIRDLDSLDIAVKASLTGHLVFSTLHTNDAVSVVTRLIDMGLAPALIAATLRLCLAQRLVRRLCAACARPVALGPESAAALGVPEAAGERVHEPGGCVYCAGRGYDGQTGLFELARITAPVATAVARGAGRDGILEAVQDAGFRTLRADGAAKVRAGVVTVRDVLAATLGGEA